jgi:two-component system chemotaxis response regulator CheB
MSKIKVLIVDDSALVRKAITDILTRESNIEILATAQDPLFAINKMDKLGSPDVIILDIEMPRMDGLTFLKKIMSENPIPVIICSSIAKKGSKPAMEALSLGAVEVIEKPELQVKDFFDDYKSQLIAKIRAASMSKVKKATVKLSKNNFLSNLEDKKSTNEILPLKKPNAILPATKKIVAIGSSTGGVQVLERIILGVGEKSPPILIVQHMPAGFTASLAKRLDSLSRLNIKEAQNGDKLLHNQVLIAPGDQHMFLKRSGTTYYVEVKQGPKISRHRPSVDVLFRSFANEAGRNGVGFILTGMGDDGARGMKEMKTVGAMTYAQSENTCTVYGMPKEAVAMGGVDQVMDPGKMIEIIKKL